MTSRLQRVFWFFLRAYRPPPSHVGGQNTSSKFHLSELEVMCVDTYAPWLLQGTNVRVYVRRIFLHSKPRFRKSFFFSSDVCQELFLNRSFSFLASATGIHPSFTAHLHPWLVPNNLPFSLSLPAPPRPAMIALGPPRGKQRPISTPWAFRIVRIPPINWMRQPTVSHSLWVRHQHVLDK